MKNIQGARLQFSADHVEMDLHALLERLPAREGAALVQPPVAVPAVADALTVDLGRLALKELLRHALNGSARAVFPLHPRSMNLGPLALEIPAGTALVVDVAVTHGRVDREGTHCSVEPPVQLPLGREFHGVYVDDSGYLKARLAGLPDINISLLLLRGLKLPAQVKDLLPFIFRESSATKDDDGPGLLDTAHIQLEAKGLQLTPDPMQLGDILLHPGPDTRLDVSYQDGVLRVEGLVDITDATVGGLGFHIHGLKGQSHAVLRIPLGDAGQGGVQVELKGLNVSAGGARFQVPQQAQVTLGSVVASDGSFVLDTARHHWELTLPNVQGTVEQGQVTITVSNQPIPVALQKIVVAGSLSARKHELSVDLAVQEGSVSVRDVDVDVALVRFRVTEAQCSTTGRFRYGPNEGFVFEGVLRADASVGSGNVNVAGLLATVGAGTHVDVTLQHLAARRDGLRRIQGSAQGQLVLTGGQVPMMTGRPLTFSGGAGGELTLESFSWNGMGTMPVVEGRITARAASDECVLDERLLVLPAGTAGAQVDRFTVATDGVLRAHGIRLTLAP